MCLRHLVPFLLAALVIALPAPLWAQTISAAECRLVVRHVPAADVAFRPGVDVHGRPVAPAELHPPAEVLPERLRLVLSVDVRRRLGLPAWLEGDLPLGVITVADGTLLLNGRPIAPEAANGLAAACAAALRR